MSTDYDRVDREGIDPRRPGALERDAHPLWEGHRERVRLRMERLGWNSLRPYEMLEMLMTMVEPRRDLTDLARALIERFGDVGSVLDAPVEQLMAFDGMQRNMAGLLHDAGELVRAYIDAFGDVGVSVVNFHRVRRFLAQRRAVLRTRPLWLLLADFEFELISFRPLEGGSVWYDPQNMCEMVEQALSFSACYAWIVRLDEPDRAPRGQELWHLEGIARTLRAVGVELLDFILMGREDFYSMNVHGGMEVLRRESADLALHERYASD